MVIVIKGFCILLLIGNGISMQSSKVIEGYPVGFLSECPGSNKPAIISKKSLRNLGIVILGHENTPLPMRSKMYNYYQAKNMIKDPNFDVRRKTVMFLGGFLDSPAAFVSQIMGRAYKKLGYNVLLLEANKFLTRHYPVSSRFLRPIGKHIAEMLTNLTDAGMDLEKFELAGISLGGQGISFIAKNYYRLTGKKIPRIIALDPAGPCFRHNPPEERIDSSDGDFVLALFTNIDGSGMATPVGHVNFYVNGGEYQPGDIYWLPCYDLCSHIRAYVLWFVALQNPDKFIGMKCDSVQQARERKCYDRVPRETNVLGVNTNRSNEGIYYLPTGSSFPYYMGKKGLDRNNDFIVKAISEFNEKDVMTL